MRVVLSALLAFSTGCSFLLAEKPGPRCEETGADIADTTTAVVSGLTGLLLLIAAAECLDSGCGSDGKQVVFPALAGLAGSTALFTASAIHGSNYNTACRRAREAAFDEEHRAKAPTEGPS